MLLVTVVVPSSSLSLSSSSMPTLFPFPRVRYTLPSMDGTAAVLHVLLWVRVVVVDTRGWNRSCGLMLVLVSSSRELVIRVYTTSRSVLSC